MEICSSCSKTVYQFEKIQISSTCIFHKFCFRCHHCSTTLKLNNYSKNNDKLFCTAHYKQLYMLKGNYDEGFGNLQHKERWQRAGKQLTNLTVKNV